MDAHELGQEKQPEVGCGGEISLSATLNSYSMCLVRPPSCTVATCCPRVLPCKLLSLIFSMGSICFLFIECTQYLFSEDWLDWELLVRVKLVWSVGLTLFNVSLVNEKLMTSVLWICEWDSRVYSSYWHTEQIQKQAWFLDVAYGVLKKWMDLLTSISNLLEWVSLESTRMHSKCKLSTNVKLWKHKICP